MLFGVSDSVEPFLGDGEETGTLQAICLFFFRVD